MDSPPWPYNLLYNAFIISLNISHSWVNLLTRLDGKIPKLGFKHLPNVEGEKKKAERFWKKTLTLVSHYPPIFVCLFSSKRNKKHHWEYFHKFFVVVEQWLGVLNRQEKNYLVPTPVTLGGFLLCLSRTRCYYHTFSLTIWIGLSKKEICQLKQVLNTFVAPNALKSDFIIFCWNPGLYL